MAPHGQEKPKLLNLQASNLLMVTIPKLEVGFEPLSFGFLSVILLHYTVSYTNATMTVLVRL
jgi:hypothetical protein